MIHFCFSQNCIIRFYTLKSMLSVKRTFDNGLIDRIYDCVDHVNHSEWLKAGGRITQSSVKRRHSGDGRRPSPSRGHSKEPRNSCLIVLTLKQQLRGHMHTLHAPVLVCISPPHILISSINLNIHCCPFPAEKKLSDFLMTTDTHGIKCNQLSIKFASAFFYNKYSFAVLVLLNVTLQC